MKKANTDNKEYMTFEEALAYTKLPKDAFKRSFCGDNNKFRLTDGEFKIARSVLDELIDHGVEITEEEQRLLDRLEAGEFDGQVGDEFEASNGYTYRTVIEKGIPRRYRRKDGCYYSDRYDEMRAYNETMRKEWLSDPEKLAFLAKFGFLINDEDVKKYNQERMSDDE